jgi:hypothetical protein
VVLARLASGIPGLRLITTVRGDFLTRVAQIPALGDEIGRAIYLLRPLSPEGAREAIVGPAQTKSVSFESEALVDDLVKAGSRGSLPLLQFALAELWEIRDKTTAVITAADLSKIGGVTGALARHGDGALAQLLPAQRRAGRRVLMRLVTLEDTRASLSEEEIVAGEAPAKAALSALVNARLVVVREVGDRVVFEIAHEALLAGWATLRGWLDEERESRAVRHRLELAVADWERLGRSREGLWTTVQLKEAALLEPETLRSRERAFLDASRAAMARGRRSAARSAARSTSTWRPPRRRSTTPSSSSAPPMCCARRPSSSSTGPRRWPRSRCGSSTAATWRASTPASVRPAPSSSLRWCSTPRARMSAPASRRCCSSGCWWSSRCTRPGASTRCRRGSSSTTSRARCGGAGPRRPS